MTPEYWQSLVKDYGGHELEGNMLSSLENYVLHHIEPGGFLRSVLQNDFQGAIARAHPCLNLPYLKTLMGFINMALPSACYGDEKTVEAWLKKEIV